MVGDGTITGTMTGAGAGTVQVSQAVTIGTAGATLDFPGNLFQWAGGAITVSAGGTLTNQAGATLTIAASVRLLGTLNNDGTIDQTAGPFDVNVGALAVNEPDGTYNIEFDGQFLNGFGSGTLENRGRLIKTTGSGTSTVDQFFVNDNGTIEADSGSLDFDFASYAGTSTFVAAQGAVIDLGFTQSGGVVGDGTISGILTGSGMGTVQLSQSVSVGDGGLFLRFTGAPFEWLGGTITPLGTGELTNEAGSSMTIAAGGGEELIGELINAGTITQTGTGQVNITPGSLDNEAGAVYDIQNTSLRVAVLQNSGLFEKSSGTSTSLIGNEVDNTGTIEVDAGGLEFFGNGTLDQVSGNALTAGTWIVNNGATISLPSGTNITTSQAAITLDGSGATFTSIQNLASSTSLTLTGGASFTTTGNFSNAGTLTVGAGSTFSVTGSYTQGASDTLNAQLGGVPSSGQFGQVAVTGSAMLAGTLQSELVDGYVPTAGDSFPIMTFAEFNRQLRQHQFSALPRRQPVPGRDQSHEHHLHGRDVGRRPRSHQRHRQS